MTAQADVLVVEDEPVVRDGITRVLASAGLTVAAFPDAASALASPATEGCPLVLCDLILPDRSGVDLLRALRARRPEVPFVIITGFATQETLARALEVGATGVLPKPFDEAELLAVVRRALGDRVASSPGRDL